MKREKPEHNFTAIGGKDLFFVNALKAPVCSAVLFTIQYSIEFLYSPTPDMAKNMMSTSNVLSGTCSP